MADLDSKDKGLDDFYETMAMSGDHSMGVTDSRRSVSFVAGLVLLFAAIAGLMDTFQSDGQIFGLFAFNAWNTWLAIAASVAAFYAVYKSAPSRLIWGSLAVGYGVITLVGLFVGDGKVLGLLANNYANVWAGAAFTAVFAYLGAKSQDM